MNPKRGHFIEIWWGVSTWVQRGGGRTGFRLTEPPKIREARCVKGKLGKAHSLCGDRLDRNALMVRGPSGKGSGKEDKRHCGLRRMKGPVPPKRPCRVVGPRNREGGSAS